MRKMIENAALLLALLFAAPLSAFAAAPDAEDVDRRFRALYDSFYQEPETQGSVSRTGEVVDSLAFAETSFDAAAAIASGDWTGLAKAYSNPWYPDEMSENSGPSPEILASWWDSLGDEMLTSLIEQALKSNRDLQVARSKVVEARAQLGMTRAVNLPWLDNTNSWSRGKNPTDAGGSGSETELYKLNIDASWEIDIFGGRRQATKAAAASLEAQYADLHNAWVSLSSETALTYISVRTLQERIRIARSNLDLQQDTLDMLQSMYDAGLTDSLALSQAQYTLQQTKASIPPLQASLESSMNVLSILVGEVPGSMVDYLGESLILPRPVSSDLVGIPANVLRRRPDIRSAERRLASQIATTKSAESDLLPKFYLAGAIGLASASTGRLFDSDAELWSFGPRITLPIFHGGAIRKNIQVQTARQEQLLSVYEQTVLQAVSEVRDALAANVLEIRRNESLRVGVEAARNALAAAEDRYRQGLSDFSNVINAQRALLTLEESCAISEGEIVANVVRLFKALGGGWAPLLQPLPEEGGMFAESK